MATDISLLGQLWLSGFAIAFLAFNILHICIYICSVYSLKAPLCYG